MTEFTREQLAAVGVGGWVRDAPVDAGPTVSSRKVLPRLVAESDHAVEALTAHQVDRPRRLPLDVNAELLTKYPDRMRMDAILGASSDAAHLYVIAGSTAEQGLRDR